MPTLAAIQEKTVRAVDRRFAERLALFFLAQERPDPDRANLTASGVLRVGRGREDSPAGRVQSWGSRIASGKAQAHIARATYQGPPIRKGDKVRALDRPGQPFFAVSRVDDRDAARLVLELVEA